MHQDNRCGGNQCICAMPINTMCCETEVPQHDPCPSLRHRLQAPVVHHICGPKACQIFGGHDLNYYPEEHEFCSNPRTKYKHFTTNSLGSPVGLVQSSFGLKSSDVKASELNQQKFATYLKAFAKIYLTNENEWDTGSVDFLLREGQQLYTESNLNADPDEIQHFSDIYSDLESKVKRAFELGGCSFQLELSEKFQLDPSPLEYIEEEEILDLPLKYLKLALRSFFRVANYCLLTVNNWYMLVWKARGIFFVFDFNGRRVNDFMTDNERGVAMLICLRSLDNICHLVTNLSGLGMDTPFNLREMKVVKLTDPDGKTMTRDYGRRLNQFEVVNSDYAYLKASLHLTLNRADPLRNRSALPVGVAALLASKIDHPATWNQRVLDRIICYGVNICRCCWEQCLNSKEPVDLDQFPNQLKMGQFLVSFLLSPRRYEGTWKCVPNFKQSELALAIEKCFDANENNLLIQVGHQIYAIWKKNNFIYLFDPYRHRITGNIIREGADTKSSTLRMFRSMDTFFSVFTQILLETNRTTSFFIHKLQIKRLDFAERIDGMPPIQEVYDDYSEVRSLNESICFEEDEAKCLTELGEISDYEDDDITSDVVQLDLKEPKSEEESEEGMEEEEGGMEGLSEYESSSSGDGAGAGRKKKKKKGGKGKDKKSSDKDSGGKGKKNKKGKSKTKDKDMDKLREKSTKKGKHKGEGEDEGEEREKDKDKDKDKEKKKKSKSKGSDEEGSDDNEDSSKKKKRKKDRNEGDEDDDDDKENKRKKFKDRGQEGDKKNKMDEDGEESKRKNFGDKSDGNYNKTRASGDADGLESDKKSGDRKGDDSDKIHGEIDNKDGDRTKIGETGDKFGDDIADTTGDKTRSDRDRGKKKGDRDGDGDQDDEGGQTTKRGLNNYPGYSNVAHDMAVVGSESGTYESICKLLRAGFKCADRILTMTPWGNYVVFRKQNLFEKTYFLFDGCTCNVNRFRHLDLNCGTAGLLYFTRLHEVVCYIIDSQKIRECLNRNRKNVVDDICKEYC